MGSITTLLSALSACARGGGVAQFGYGVPKIFTKELLFCSIICTKSTCDEIPYRR